MTNKPESWNDESLKALSVRAVRAARDDVESAHYMRACVLSGLTLHGLAPPSAAELRRRPRTSMMIGCARPQRGKPSAPRWRTTAAVLTGFSTFRVLHITLE